MHNEFVEKFIVTNSRIFTGDPAKPWVQAMVVEAGRITATGTENEIREHSGSATPSIDLRGSMVMPALVDVHAHLGLGGSQLAFELPILPTDTVAQICAKVRDWAERLDDGEWIVGGIVGSTVMDDIGVEDLKALDEASLGHPALLRDDSMHNRWVNTVALELTGIDATSGDPEGGRYVRDAGGNLTGVLQELAGGLAEQAITDSLKDLSTRHDTAILTAVRTMNSFGVTSVQDAATMEYALQSLSRLDERGELSARVVASMPSRTFIEPGITGSELYAVGAATASRNVRPTFSKYVLDGVPMTRTSAMIHPYRCNHHDDEPDFTGESLWAVEDLVDSLDDLVKRGLHAKLHATGDAAVRIVLDAVAIIRERHGEAPVFHIAHTEYIDEADLARFASLGVVADASPYLWFPSVIQESIAKQIPAEIFDRSWPLRDLIEGGAIVAGGSDWPCAAPTPDPWTGLGAMVTRTNPDPSVSGQLNPNQSLELEDAIAAFTTGPARAMGLADEVGQLVPGMSADFIVLDQDLFEADPEKIYATRVLATYFEGRQVYAEADSMVPRS